MDHNTKREKWIDEVLESTIGMVPAQPDSGLHERVMRKIDASKTNTTSAIPLRGWAAAAVLLLAINMLSVIRYTKRSGDKAPATGTNAIAFQVQSAPSYNYW